MPESDDGFLVTGGTGALGQSIVRELLSETKDKVVVVTRRSDYQPPFKFDSGRFFVVPSINLVIEEQARFAVETAAARIGGRIDVVNCVGSFPGYRPLVDVAGNDALDVMKTNYLTVYNMAREAIPVLRSRGGGHFLAFTSISRPGAFPWMAAFEAAKAAVEQLVKQIANEESEFGVVANAMALATLMTEAEKKMKPQGDFEHWLEPEQVAAVVREFLADRKAIVNGNVIRLFRYSRSFFRMAYFDRIGK